MPEQLPARPAVAPTAPVLVCPPKRRLLPALHRYPSMSQAPGDFSYDELRYVGTAYSQTHPDWLSAVARLHGLQPAPVDRCRVLEIACGDGNNLLPMAYALPNSTFLGIDLAAGPLAAGREIAARLGLSNLRLEALDLTAFPADAGQFDYIIAHGLYSWCPPAVRERLLALCAAHLAPQGIAFVSFNAYPGYHLVDLERELMRFHLGNSPARTPGERVGEALGILDFVAKAQDADSLSGQLLAEARKNYSERIRSAGHAGVSWFHHDLLSEHNTPYYFRHFMEHAQAHGLQYVSDALPRVLHVMDLPAQTRETLQGLRGNPLVLEQYLDFVLNIRFRQVLLCRADAVVDRTLGPAAMEGLFVAGELSPVPGQGSGTDPDGPEDFTGPAGTIAIRHAHARNTVRRIGAAWPEAIAFRELAADLPPGVTRGHLADLLLRVCIGKFTQFRTRQGIAAAVPGERPEASALARLQAETSSLVINLHHERISVGPFTRRLLRLLDGSRDRAALLEALRAWVTSEQAAADYAEQAGAENLPIPTLEALAADLDGDLVAVAKLGVLLP